MNIEVLRAEIVTELDNCIEQAEREKLMFYHSFEKALAQTELLAEELTSDTLKHFITLFRCRLFNHVGSELRVDKTFLADLKQFRHFVAGVVGK